MDTSAPSLILIVDDETKIRRIVASNLERAGYDVISAADGMHALEILELQYPKPALVLMDVMMPELDGLSATRAIRGMDRPDAQLPIIAMTANLFEEDVAACLAAGMDAHIPKPLEAGQMIRTIAEWLERKKQ
mgnify:CR=1 FL=1